MQWIKAKSVGTTLLSWLTVGSLAVEMVELVQNKALALNSPLNWRRTTEIRSSREKANNFKILFKPYISQITLTRDSLGFTNMNVNHQHKMTVSD